MTMTKVTFDIAIASFIKVSGFTVDQIANDASIQDIFIKFCAAAQSA